MTGPTPQRCQKNAVASLVSRRSLLHPNGQFFCAFEAVGVDASGSIIMVMPFLDRAKNPFQRFL